MLFAQGMGWPYLRVAAASFVAATLVNYLLSVRFVFVSGARFARRWEVLLVFVVSAIGLGITSGVLFRFHNQPAYNEPPEDPCLPPQATCPYKYDNLVGGSVTAALAGALLIGGAIALYYDNAPPKRRLVIAPAVPARE